MKQVEIIRILDDTTFVINAGTNKGIELGYFIDVLKTDKSYNYIAKVEEVYPDLSLCKRYGEQRLFYGDIVRIRYPDDNQITTKVIKSKTSKKRRKKRG
ncbi:hypothetical protein [Mammaliicoccus sp. H-M32]|uniref:hypothetical protein n=1 Tax=Mammaliicoccus sp. H-M32 TaxID=2898691 RepID=UPI001EFA92CD|nr:hypothetical protein [Mammaliicoccus sp. H-M32]